MAIKLDDLYAGRINAADANYPYGSVKNRVGGVADTGTPLDQDLANDTEGFKQAILTEAEIIPSGAPDNATTSQYLDGLKVIFPAKTELATAVSGAALVGFSEYRNVYERLLSSINPLDYGMVGGGVDDSAAMNTALALSKALGLQIKMPQGEYLFNVEIDFIFDIVGTNVGANSSVNTIIKPFNTALPVFTFIGNTQGSWTQSVMKDLTANSGTTGVGTFFQFGKLPYTAGQVNIGRVKFVNVATINFDKHYLKLFGNIGNEWISCQGTLGNYYYHASSSGLNGSGALGQYTHCGDDLFIGGHIKAVNKCVFLVRDNGVSSGTGGWRFRDMTVEQNQGCTWYFDIAGSGYTMANAPITIDSVWLESNGTGGPVTLDLIAGPTLVTPNGRLQGSQLKGYNYNQIESAGFSHGTVSRKAVGINLGQNAGLSAINIETGELPISSVDGAAITWSSFDTQNFGSWIRSLRSVANAGTDNRDIEISTGESVFTNGDIRIGYDKSFTIGHKNRFDPGGNVALPNEVMIEGPSGSEGASLLQIAYPNNGNGDVNFYGCAGVASVNAAATGMRIGNNSVTLRSINAGGTINASGADYAEYMRKADSCGAIKKGDICGIDKDGLLTDRYNEAVSFVVKSTDPSYVGGDNWFSEDEPEPPATPVFEIIEAPGIPESRNKAARIQYEKDLKEFEDKSPVVATNNDKLEKQYQKDLAKHKAKLIEFKERLEAARDKVDRIAFCGQVPVNVVAEVGDYIVPKELNGGITGEAVKAPTFEQYQNAIGKVIKVESGVVTIIVKVV